MFGKVKMGYPFPNIFIYAVFPTESITNIYFDGNINLSQL